MDNKIISTPYPKTETKLKSVGKTFFDKMLEYKDLIAHTYGPTGETETYRTVLQKTIRVALRMRSEGIGPKDIISISSFTTVDCLIPFYASYFLGAIPANLYPDLTLAETTHLLKQVSPKIIFVCPKALEVTENALRDTNINAKIVLFGNTSKHLKFSEFLLPSPDEDQFVPYETDDLKGTASIVFTSGSTGLSKAACLTHLGLLSNVAPHPSGYVCLAFSNLHWVSGTILPYIHIINGMNRLIYPEFNPDAVLGSVSKYKVNLLSLMLYPAIEVLKNGVPPSIDISSLISFILAGAIVTKEQIQHFRKCLPNTLISNVYGQAETNGYSLGFKVPEVGEEKLDSIGTPLPGFSCKVVDLNTEEVLGPNQKGELLIKSEFLMSGYYNINSTKAFDSDGFYKTGDVAYYDEDHHFYVVDRFQEMVKYREWYLYPSRLEKILLTHPSVHVCVVFGIPHPQDIQHLMGVVVLKPEYVNKINGEELDKFVNDRVSEHEKIRAGIKIVEKIPVTITSKLSRMKMKNAVLKGEI